MKRLIRRGANAALGPLGVEVVRRQGSSSGYISTADTVAAAQDAGLSVVEYLDELWGSPGATRRLFDRFVLEPPPRRVCEIGAGVGRAVDQFISRYRPESYEVYEIAEDWRDWLATQYPVTIRHADGETLSETADGSVDLVNAHGVFVYTPFLVTCSYFRETVRVLRPGGHAVFDVYTEDCFDDEVVTRWLESEDRYPVLTSAAFVRGYFASHGFTPISEFDTPHGEGVSRYFVFRR